MWCYDVLQYSLPRCCQMMRNDAGTDTSSRYLAPAPATAQRRVPATLPCSQPWAQLRNAAYAILHLLQLLACSWYKPQYETRKKHWRIKRLAILFPRPPAALPTILDGYPPQPKQRLLFHHLVFQSLHIVHSGIHRLRCTARLRG